MHWLTRQALLDEFEKISRILPSGKFLPEAASALKRIARPPSATTARPALLQYQPGKSAPEMAEWMGKYVPGYRTAAASGAGPEISQTALERLAFKSAVPADKGGRFLRPPTPEETQASLANVRRMGGLNRQLTESIQEANKVQGMAQAAPPMGLRRVSA